MTGICADLGLVASHDCGHQLEVKVGHWGLRQEFLQVEDEGEPPCTSHPLPLHLTKKDLTTLSP